MSDSAPHRSATAEEALERVESGIARARERADRADHFRNRYESLDATGESRQDGVRLTVDAASLVTAVSITDAGASRSGRQVAAAILRAHDDAVRRLRDEVEVLAADAFGAASPATTAVLDELPRPQDDQPDTPSQRSTW